MGWLMAKEELVAIQITGLGMVITGVILTGIKK
jgi:multidrug transporter EmrE-like cation transporter